MIRRSSLKKWRERSVISKIFIFSEWTKTEPNYFKSMKDDIESQIRRKIIKLDWTAMNTISLVNHVIDYMNSPKFVRWIDEARAVFDRDSFPKSDFNDAIFLAKKEWINVAYSNECFELWYILHFQYRNTSMHRNDCASKLTEELIKNWLVSKSYKYKKNDREMYQLLSLRQGDAIRNSKKLIDMHKKDWITSYSDKNPSNTVYELVEHLNKLKKQFI